MPLPFILAQGGGGNFGSLIVLGLLWLFIFWFVIFRPQRQAEQRRLAQINSLKKNDKVLTSSGIIGTVVQLKDDDIRLKVCDKTGATIRVLKSAIARKIDGASKSEEAVTTQNEEGSD